MLTWLIVLALAVAAMLVCELLDSPRGRAVAKTTASTAFVATALVGGALQTGFGQAMVVALVLCWWGDVFLLSRRQGVFLAGLISFLLGHLAFAVAFALRGVSLPWVGASLVVLAVAAAIVVRRLLPEVDAKMRTPVLAYIAVITAMVALAAGTVGWAGAPVLLVAAAMFYVSDLSVAIDRFVSPGFVNRLWGLPLYFGAQALFAIAATTAG